MFITPLASNTFGTRTAGIQRAVGQKVSDTVRVVKFSIPSKSAEMVNFEVTCDFAKKISDRADRTNIMGIKYQIGERENSYFSQKGITERKFRQIQKNIQQAIEEGKNFIYELIKAQHSFSE